MTSRSFSDEAIVLRVHDVGEAGRLCVLLTREHGKIAVIAAGARKLLSRKGGSLLPLQRVVVECRHSKSGYTVQSASTLVNGSHFRSDLHAYAQASGAAHVLSRLLEDEEPVPDVYDLAKAFFDACAADRGPHLFSLFILQMLHALGTLPSPSYSVLTHRPLPDNSPLKYSAHHGGFFSGDEEEAGIVFSPAASDLLRSLPVLHLIDLPALSPDDQRSVALLAHSCIGSQLGGSAAALASALMLESSSAVTPTW